MKSFKLIHKFTVSFLNGLFLLTLFSACSNKMSAINSSGTTSSYKYTLKSKTEALADGFTDLSVEIYVYDLSNHPVAGHVPTTSLLSAAGINYSACVASDNDGVSTCTFRSTLEGTKQVSFGSLMTTDITFYPFTLKTAGIFGIVSGMDYSNVTMDDSNTVSATIGSIIDSPKQRSSNWIFFTDSAIRQ